MRALQVCILTAVVVVLSYSPLAAQIAPVPPVWEIATWNNPPAQVRPGIGHGTFWSPILSADVGYSFVLPPGYESSSQRYPVVYSLHGGPGDENRNPAQVGALMVEAIHSGAVPPSIVVFVNGGSWSYYADSWDGRIPSETLFVRELIPHIDATFRTVANRRGRALEGMSMGGFGALALSMRHPDMFGSVVAYAAGLLEEAGDGSRSLVLALPEGLSQPPSMRGTFLNVFGGRPESYAPYDPFALVPTLAASLRDRLPIRLVIGTADGLWNVNQRFHELMLEHDWAHDFVGVPGVGHAYPELYAAEGLNGLLFHADANGWR
jgi:endo-1,4-beta-xylanase